MLMQVDTPNAQRLARRKASYNLGMLVAISCMVETSQEQSDSSNLFLHKQDMG